MLRGAGWFSVAAMPLPLEDNFDDVLMKASTGLGIGKQALAERAGLSLRSVTQLLRGIVDVPSLRAVAPILGLHAEALVAMAQGSGTPAPIAFSCLRCYTTPFPVPGYAAMTVNSYLAWCAETRQAVAFDTGSNTEALQADLESRGLTLKALFLTHTHPDHVAACDELQARADAPALYAPKHEPYPQSLEVQAGDEFHYGKLRVEARLTSGHSPGGLSYVLAGLERPVAVVGDALFCLSQGGARTQYARALKNNREQLLSLPEATVLCPGHGPMTTVQWEQAHNPFFPEFK